MGVSVQQVDREDHLQQIGADRPMGDLHADRGARRARGVLQVGNVVDVDVGWGERIPRRVGYLIDDDDLRPSEVRELEQKRPNGFGRRRCRQYGAAKNPAT